MKYVIYTDASYAKDFKVGSYAFIAKFEEFTHKESGILKRDIPNNLVSELLAFSKALHFINCIIHKEDRPNIDIDVHTDCEWVMKVIKGKVSGGKHNMIIRAVKHAMTGYNIKVYHVKAHQKITNEHMLANSWCDLNARNEMIKGGWL